MKIRIEISAAEMNAATAFMNIFDDDIKARTAQIISSKNDNFTSIERNLPDGSRSVDLEITDTATMNIFNTMACIGTAFKGAIAAAIKPLKNILKMFDATEMSINGEPVTPARKVHARTSIMLENGETMDIKTSMVYDNTVSDMEAKESMKRLVKDAFSEKAAGFKKTNPAMYGNVDSKTNDDPE